MIVADASALLAVILGEADADVNLAALASSDAVLVSAVNVWETAVRAERQNPGRGEETAEFLLTRTRAQVVAADDDAWRSAFRAWKRFGRDNHPAKLNLGDCFAYACARANGARLLYKGDDFALTDIEAA